GKSSDKSIDDERWEEGGEIDGFASAAIAGANVPPAFPPGQEVVGPLQRSQVRLAGGQKGGPLDLLLKVDARERVCAAGLGRLNRDDEAAIGERRVVPALAHSVGAEIPGVAHARHHVTAGAHTKRKKVAGSSPHRGRVLGGTQGGMAGAYPVAHPINRC